MNAATQAYIREHRADGAAAISAALAADPRFAQRIEKTDLRGLFGVQPAIPFKLKAAVANEALPVELRAGIDRLLDTSIYEDGFAAINTSVPVAAQVRALSAVAVQAGVLTEAEAADLLALGGGKLLETLTEAEVQAELDRLAVDLGLEELGRRFAAGANAAAGVLALAREERRVPEVAELTAAFTAGLEE